MNLRLRSGLHCIHLCPKRTLPRPVTSLSEFPYLHVENRGKDTDNSGIASSLHDKTKVKELSESRFTISGSQGLC